MQSSDHIAELLYKYLRNELSSDEEKQLNDWRQESFRNEQLFLQVKDPEQIRSLMQGYYSKKKSWEKIVSQAPELKNETEKKIQWRFLRAAMIISILGITAVIALVGIRYSGKKSVIAVVPGSVDTVSAYLLPVMDKAVLTLSGGEKLILDKSKNQDSFRLSGNNIKELASGNLLYGTLDAGKTEHPEYNKLETPRGGQFRVSLPDGTKVWLNALSSIRYPIAFTGNERKVEISGEVYFEVSKNEKQPFVVETPNAKIQVLGTHFNVNAYNDEPTTQITLLEGRVRTTSGSVSIILKPGDQAEISTNGSKRYVHLVNNVDLTQVLSWKEGRIFFQDEDIPRIMRMISRWYDIDVRYQGVIPSRNITGAISRNENLPELLKVLEWNNIHFKTEGTKITITP